MAGFGAPISGWFCAPHDKSGYSDATIYLECTLLKQIVKWLIEEEKALPESHRIRLKLERSQESSTYCYSSEEVEAMIGLCRQQPALDWLANIIIILATTGMRIGEAIGLRWCDVDLGAGMITLPDQRHSAWHKHAGAVRTTKGRRSRRVPIHAALRSVLDKMPREADGRVFAGPKRGLLKADSIRNVLIAQVQTPLKERFPTPPGEIGFQHGRLHSFRHFFVSMAFLGGASEGEIREWVGHTNSRIVERYRHLRSEDAIRKMNQIYFFGGAEGNGTDVDVADHHQDGAGDDKDKTKSCAVDGSGVPIRHQRAQKSEVPASNQQRKETRDDGEQPPKVT
jgi:integrase